MADKETLREWVREALSAQGGSATLVEVARHIWATHERHLRASGDLFYTWQYDMRWAANALRRAGIMKPVQASPTGVWELAQGK